MREAGALTHDVLVPRVYAHDGVQPVLGEALRSGENFLNRQRIPNARDSISIMMYLPWYSISLYYGI